MYNGKQKYEWDRTARIVWAIFRVNFSGQIKLNENDLNPFRQEDKKKKEKKIPSKENWETFKGIFVKEKNGT